MKLPALINKFCSAVWEYDAEKNEVYLHYDNMDPELCGQWLPYNEIEQLYRKEYVYKLDQEIWDHFLKPEKMRQFVNGDKEEEHFYIRFEHTKKGNEWHEVYFQHMEEGRMLLASRDIKEMQRNAVIAKAVVPEFDYVCCIDVTSKSYVLYYSDTVNTVVPQSASDDYHRILEEFNRIYVVPEEVEEVTAKMRLENVIKELEDKEEYILHATVKEKGHLTYKKVRFSYEDETKARVLLTRIDVGELFGERKLKEKEREKRLRYLQNMPVAFCSTKVLLDNKGEPYDFQFTYCNRAHEELECVQEGELLGKNFYEFFEETDPKWLKYYYETAYKGINHVIRRYSPEIQKHLLIYTFQSEPGQCECVLLDISEEYFLTQELQRSREDLRRILKTTTALVFQYRPENEEVILYSNEKGQPEQFFTKTSLKEMLTERELLDPEYFQEFEDLFFKIRSGEHLVSSVVRCKVYPEVRWNWYKITLFDYQDGYTRERKVLGFLQNIDEDRSREEELRKKAQMDPLTGVFNVGAGKEEIRERLEKRSEEDQDYYAMFVIDMDNFKAINDTMGHMIGDKVLVEFAKVLRKTFRTGDVLYRLGGDEFVVFVDKIHEPEQSIGVMLHRFQLNMGTAKTKYPFLACSIGVFVTNQYHPFEKCYEMADSALYETKKSNKGYYTITREN